ncbi:hypothetical protein PALB_12030 [Pseudoalteromonas luteoviolacea B = ATCC 29581]|nr:hypothetical protein PALB_12030 [Pseudoalteromonas luteoviolacea B = ATCC 29581]
MKMNSIELEIFIGINYIQSTWRCMTEAKIYRRLGKELLADNGLPFIKINNAA